MAGFISEPWNQHTMIRNAKDMMDRFCQKYDGIFGKFEPDPESDACNAVSTHDVKSRFVSESVVMIAVADDPATEYAEKKEFIRSKGVKTAMGTPVPIDDPHGFEDWTGFINNFSKMGVKGGFIYCVGRFEDTVACIQAFSTKKQISEEELDGFLSDILTSIKG